MTNNTVVTANKTFNANQIAIETAFANYIKAIEIRDNTWTAYREYNKTSIKTINLDTLRTLRNAHKGAKLRVSKAFNALAKVDNDLARLMNRN